MSDGSDKRILEHVLAGYDLGELRGLHGHGGTAGKTWRIETDSGVWLLRMRGARTSSDEAVAFDHGLRRHLIERGVPTAAPVSARDGRTFTRVDENTYEIYPFITGRTLAQADAAQLRNAARALARFHQAAAACPERDRRAYPLARSLPPLAQYATIGFEQQSDRMEDPDILAAIYADVESHPEASGFGDAAEVCRGRLQRLHHEYDRATYDALPMTVTHGDYTLANLLFDDADRVAGIFDLDWARWSPRVRDLADGMYFIGAVRGAPLHSGDIWSLTETADFDAERCTTWLSAYHKIAAISRGEMDAIPLAFAARWLSVRVEGMAKVPPEDRVRFCFREITEPLRWLDENWPLVAESLDLKVG